MAQRHGNTEVEVCEDEETDLIKLYDGCKKYPGHPQFIPIKDLNIDHLPKGHRDTELLEAVKAIANMTVKICVRMVSSSRPEFWPGTNVPYPFYNVRGNVKMRLGTGEVHVSKFIEGRGYDAVKPAYSFFKEEQYRAEYKTCPCEQCLLSNQPSSVWWEIYLRTVQHLVFDETEAKHVSCQLFYDEQNSPMVTLDQFKVSSVVSEKDRCLLKCVTCDDVGKRLYELNVISNDIWGKVSSKYRKKSDVIFIVSHPHGCPKRASFGHLVDNHKVGKSELYGRYLDTSQWVYTAGTCPGSSGALIYYLGQGGDRIHAGCLESGNNYCCVDIDYS